MLCQACRQNNANVHWTKVVNDNKTEVHLCSDCARENGLQPSLDDIPEIFGNLLSNILSEAPSHDPAPTRSKRRRRVRKCPGCGNTYAALEKKGLLGCAQCYDAFADELKILLRRVHGDCVHKGRRPAAYGAVSSYATVERLRRELQEAILHEKFERAAELRNLIRASETGQKSKPGH